MATDGESENVTLGNGMLHTGNADTIAPHVPFLDPALRNRTAFRKA